METTHSLAARSSRPVQPARIWRRAFAAVVATVAMAFGATPAFATNVVVYRVGDGSVALSSAAAPVFLD